jgi:hypothetical protein
MTRHDQFAEVFRVPPAMRPYIELVVDEREIDLVLTLHRTAMTPAEVAEAMRMPRDELGFRISDFGIRISDPRLAVSKSAIRNPK